MLSHFFMLLYDTVEHDCRWFIIYSKIYIINSNILNKSLMSAEVFLWIFFWKMRFNLNGVYMYLCIYVYIFMFQKRQSIDLVASRQTSVLTWVGLGLMSVQFGILARLTWWEYSWDIMEPVTYFVTYGTAMAVYAYYVLTKQVYSYDNNQLVLCS